MHKKTEKSTIQFAIKRFWLPLLNNKRSLRQNFKKKTLSINEIGLQKMSRKYCVLLCMLCLFLLQIQLTWWTSAVWFLFSLQLLIAIKVSVSHSDKKMWSKIVVLVTLLNTVVYSIIMIDRAISFLLCTKLTFIICVCIAPHSVILLCIRKKDKNLL